MFANLPCQKSYKLYKTRKSGKPLLLVDKKRKNDFETKLSYDGIAKYVIVKALAANGTVLGQTDVVEVTDATTTTPPTDDDDKTSDPDSKEPDSDPDSETSDPYWYSDIVFFLAAGAGLTVSAFVIYLILRRIRRGAAGSRWSLLDLLSRGKYRPLRDDGRELQDR